MNFTIQVRHEEGWGHLTRCPCVWTARNEVDYLSRIGLVVRAIDEKGQVAFQTADYLADDQHQTETDSPANESVAP